MGSPKAQTLGYKYYMGLHMGGIQGPADALLEVQAGGRRAWIGHQDVSGPISINAPDLFGGEQREGGIQGTLDVMMGESTQGPNDYLAAKQGTPQPGYRGFVGLVWRGGMVAAMNPYIKPWAFRFRRILKGWANDECWYPEKASIVVDASIATDVPGTFFVAAGSMVSNLSSDYGIFNASDFYGAAEEIAQVCVQRRNEATGTTYTFATAASYGSIGSTEIVGTSVELGTSVGIAAVAVTPICEPDFSATINGYVHPLGKGSPDVVCNITDAPHGMNPAHIIYQCLTDPRWGMGYPTAAIDDASFRAAADVLYAEGFGLCLKWTNQTSIADFIGIVADHAGLNVGQDRRTGLFRIVMLRGGYDRESLPVFNPTNSRVVKFQRPSMADTVNEVIVKFRDVVTGKEATAPPAQNLANIQGQGRVVSETSDYSGLPTLKLAVRAAMRDLIAKSSPLWRLTIEIDRSGSDLLPGEPFVIDWPPLGINIVVRSGEINYGNAASGKVTADVVEDVFGLPSATYLAEQPSGWTPPQTLPQVSPATTAFEVPFQQLAQTLPSLELDGLPDDVGFLASAAVRPGGVPLNYTLHTALPPADYAAAATGDFAPSAVLDVGVDRLETVLVVTGGTDLDDLTVGTAAWLGEGADAEMVRIDAVDIVLGEITVGRGCGDTIPHVWPAGTRLWGFDLYAAADTTQYVDGETVNAKVLTRAAGGTLAITAAAELEVEMGARQTRPYPPAGMTINGGYWPTSIGVSDLALVWAHRDRLLQSDQLVDTTESSIGPEPGVTYTLRVYNESDALIATIVDISDAAYTYSAVQESIDSGYLSGGYGVNYGNSYGLSENVLSYGAAVTALNPVFYWRLNESSGGTAVDASANSLPGSYNGTVTYATTSTLLSDLGNKAITLGASAYISRANHASIAIHNPFTFACRVVLTGTAATARTLFHKGNYTVSGQQGMQMYVAASSNNIGIQYHNGSYRNVIFTGVLPFGSAPIDIKLRYLGGTVGFELIVNGTKYTSAALPALVLANTEVLRVGCSYESGLGSYFLGVMDEVWWLASAISDADAGIVLGAASAASAGPRLNYQVRFELESTREGFASYQMQEATVERPGYGFHYGNYYGGI